MTGANNPATATAADGRTNPASANAKKKTLNPGTERQPTMDELRDLIARTLHQLYGPSLGAAEHGWDAEPRGTQDMYRADADTIITALALRPEHTYGTNYPNLPPTDLKYVRHVTDWQPAHD